MVVTLNEVIRVQQMIVNSGKKLIHAIIGNRDIIAAVVELLAANWQVYQSLGNDTQATLSFWEFCELKDMHR